jgi:hypothetical protein
MLPLHDRYHTAKLTMSSSASSTPLRIGLRLMAQVVLPGCPASIGGLLWRALLHSRTATIRIYCTIIFAHTAVQTTYSRACTTCAACLQCLLLDFE